MVVGTSAALVIAVLHVRGAGSAIRFQNFVTFAFIIVSIVLVFCGLSFGSLRNLRPLFASNTGSSVTLGILTTFATSAYFFNGWQASLHAIEERRKTVSARAAILSMVVAIVASMVFYIAVILACSMAAPWQWLLSRDLPAAAAFSSIGSNRALGAVVLATAIVSLTKTWSATVWIGTRLLFAQARHGMLPPWFGALHPGSRAPRSAVLFVTALTLVGIALGRAAIVPIVDTLAICSALSIILCLLVLLRRRRVRVSPLGFTVPGGPVTIWAALSCASCMIGISIVRPFFSSNPVISMEWLLLISWGVLGSAVWLVTRSLWSAQVATSASDGEVPQQ